MSSDATLCPRPRRLDGAEAHEGLRNDSQDNLAHWLMSTQVLLQPAEALGPTVLRRRARALEVDDQDVAVHDVRPLPQGGFKVGRADGHRLRDDLTTELDLRGRHLQRCADSRGDGPRYPVFQEGRGARGLARVAGLD